MVMAPGGYWLVGTGYTTTLDARRAAHAFAATEPVPPPPGTPRANRPANWVPARCYGHTSRFRYVRRIKGNAWQARIWLGHAIGGSLNLGAFSSFDHGADDAEWLAHRAVKEFVKYYRPSEPGRGLRATIEHLKRKGYVRADLLPPRVEQLAEGSYRAVAKRRGQLLATEPVSDPWQAHEMMMKMIQEREPRRLTHGGSRRRRAAKSIPQPQQQQQQQARPQQQSQQQQVVAPDRFVTLADFLAA